MIETRGSLEQIRFWELVRSRPTIAHVFPSCAGITRREADVNMETGANFDTKARADDGDVAVDVEAEAEVIDAGDERRAGAVVVPVDVVGGARAGVEDEDKTHIRAHSTRVQHTRPMVDIKHDLVM